MLLKHDKRRMRVNPSGNLKIMGGIEFLSVEKVESLINIIYYLVNNTKRKILRFEP